jgi:hypothetical protein
MTEEWSEEMFALPRYPVLLNLAGTRETALYLAIIHHGMAASSPTGKPAGKTTVLSTAETFEEYLDRDDLAAASQPEPNTPTNWAGNAHPRAS